jgi:hypothetical protein
MGLKFVSITEEDREFIGNFIKDLITKDLGIDCSSLNSDRRD